MDVVAYAVLALLWLVILLRLPSWRKSGQQRVVTAALVCFAISGTMVIRPVRYAFDAALGVGDLSILVGHLFGLLGVVVAFELSLGASKSAFVRGAQLFFLSAMTCMIVLFFVIPRKLEEPDFGYWHARHPAVVSYQLIDIACLVIALCLVFVILFPQWRSAEPGPLRTALLLLWLAAVIGLGYSGCRAWYVVAHGFGFVERADRPVYGAVTFLLLYLSLLSAGVGAFIRFSHRWRGHIGRYLIYWRLDRLWTQLTDAVPSVVLEQPPRVLFPTSSFELWLFRRAVEIRDAQVELIGHVSPAQREEARTALRGTDDELDACTLLMALQLKRNGAVRPENQVELTWSADVSLDGELNRLLALDRALRSPAVGEAAGDVLRSATTSYGEGC